MKMFAVMTCGWMLFSAVPVPAEERNPLVEELSELWSWSGTPTHVVYEEEVVRSTERMRVEIREEERRIPSEEEIPKDFAGYRVRNEVWVDGRYFRMRAEPQPDALGYMNSISEAVVTPTTCKSLSEFGPLGDKDDPPSPSGLTGPVAGPPSLLRTAQIFPPPSALTPLDDELSPYGFLFDPPRSTRRMLTQANIRRETRDGRPCIVVQPDTESRYPSHTFYFDVGRGGILLRAESRFKGQPLTRIRVTPDQLPDGRWYPAAREFESHFPVTGESNPPVTTRILAKILVWESVPDSLRNGDRGRDFPPSRRPAVA